MPGAPDDETSPFDTLVERLFEVGRDAVKRATDAVIPRCNTCHDRAVPIRCVVCEEYACARHGHYSLGRGTCVCDLCVEAMIDEIEIVNEHGRTQEGSRAAWKRSEPRAGFPWADLGVKETATVEEIKIAFRAKARRMHPDVCTEPGAEERFKELVRAYRVALSAAGGK